MTEDGLPPQAVTSRSDDEIEAVAAHFRDAAGFDDPAHPILDLIQASASKFIATAKLKIEIVPDGSLDGDDARAISDPPTIYVIASVHAAASRNESRARMTMAHEFGHIALGHKGGARPRNAQERPAAKFVKTYENGEHQAKFFAAAYIVPKNSASERLSAPELQLRYRISPEAAKIRYSQLNKAAPGKPLADDILAGMSKLKRIVSEQQSPRRQAKSKLPFEIEKRLLWELLDHSAGLPASEFRVVDNRWTIRWTLHERTAIGGWRISNGQVVPWEDESTR